MSYGMAAALQAAVYQRLAGDAAVAALAPAGVHDALPPGPVGGTWISVGPEKVRDASDKTGAGAVHDFTVSVMTDAAGFAQAKAAAVAVSDALTGASLTLVRGRVVGLWFLAARARRIEAGSARQIDMTFRAMVEETA